MRTTSLLAGGLLLVHLGVSGATAAEGPAAPRPHILLIVADDLGWKNVGFHGGEVLTPRLDGLAAAGARLEQFYVQPVCSPTRAALMTGRYPMRYGLQVGVIWPWSQYGLPLEERLLPQALKQAGYATAITGKWHLGCYDPRYLPRQRGFDHQYGQYLGAIDYFTHDRMGGLDWHRDDRALREEGYSTELIAREATRIIREHDPSQPLFLYVPFNAPHAPLQAPQAYIDKYKQIENEQRRKYAAMATCMDDAIGTILDAIQARGMRDNTLVLFSSDNGGPLQTGANNGDLREGKATLYEGGVRVPALAVWPGKIEAGIEVKGLVHIADWYPTLLKLAGASLEQPLPLDGMDVWATITRNEPSPRTEILHNHEPGRAAVRQGNLKLIVHAPPKRKDQQAAPKVELFDISADPFERNNLTEQQPEKVKALQARIDFYARQAVPPKNTDANAKAGPDFKAPAVWGEAKQEGETGPGAEGEKR